MIRRRTSRHRRNRLIRRTVRISVIAFFALGFSLVALRHFSPSLFHSLKARTPDRQEMETSRDRLAQINAETFRYQTDRPVYPYSVVPGGIADARELKWVAEHDPVVAAHYAGFDYDHARVVRLVLARTVYVSYRIGNHVYWTRHRIKLHKGEKVVTDGKMTARGRCGNRVEELPQQATSSSEPPVAQFEQPLARAGSATESPAVPFQSALLSKPEVGPMLPLSLYSPFTGGDWVPIDPPPLPSAGVCTPGTTKKGGPGNVGASGGKGKKKGGACGPPATIPEPATWLLLASGLGLVYWQTRRRVAAVWLQSTQS